MYIKFRNITWSLFKVILIESLIGKINSSLRFPPEKYNFGKTLYLKMSILFSYIKYDISNILYNLQYLITAMFTGAVQVQMLKSILKFF